MSTRAEVALKALVGFAIGIVVATITVLSFVDGRIEHASARAAADAVAPVASDLTHHLDEMKKLRPEMDKTVERINGKLDLLIEDCYRRGGCQKR